MEQDGSNPIRINCVILNFNDGETVSRLVHMIHDYDYLEKIVLVDVEPEESTNYYRNEQDVHYVPKRKLKDIVFTAEKK